MASTLDRKSLLSESASLVLFCDLWYNNSDVNKIIIKKQKYELEDLGQTNNFYFCHFYYLVADGFFV